MGAPWSQTTLPTGVVAGTTGVVSWFNAINAEYDRTNRGKQGVGLKRDGGLLGDGSDETAAFSALMGTLAGLAPRTFKVFAEDGVYGLQPLRIIPWNVSLECENANAATLKNLGTSATTFLALRGSRTTVKGLIIDANRAALSSYTGIDGFLAIGLTKPSSVSGGGTSLAGGLVLGAGVAAGATTITVTLPYSGASSPTSGRAYIIPGDVLNICQGSTYERVRVAEGFVIANTAGAGGTCSVPLEGQLLNTYTTAANVTHCATDVEIHHNKFYGAGVQGIGMYGCTVSDNRFTNQIDCALGHFDRGNYGNRWDRNTVETYSYWAFFQDDYTQSDGVYPPNEDTFITDPMFKFYKGGPDLGSGPGAGSVELIGCNGGKGLTIQGGVLDYSAATGTTLHGGIRFNPAVIRPRVRGTHIVGGNQANTAGIFCITLVATDHNIDPQVRDVTIENCPIGVELGQATSGSVVGATMRGCSSYGINQNYIRSDAAVARFLLDGNDIDGGSAGIRMAGSPPAGSGYRGQNIITNWSFAPVALTAPAVHDPSGQTY